MQTKYIGIIIIALLIIGGGYFLLSSSYQPPAPVAPETSIPQVQFKEGELEEAAETLSVKEFTVGGTEYNFNPSSINVKAGEQVKIIFENNGKALHNLIIEELGIETKTIGGGQTDIVEFTASTSGIYTFFCSVPGHRAAGMEGSLEVQ